MIAAQISPLHVDEVHLGQKVKLVGPAFPARNVPELTGELAQISADALTDPASKILYYRAEIALSAEEAARIGQPLLPRNAGRGLYPDQPAQPLCLSGQALHRLLHPGLPQKLRGGASAAAHFRP